MSRERSLNRRFLLLQGTLAVMECAGSSYLSPILVRYGYDAAHIGLVMTLAALSAAVSRPLWGFVNDRFACARRVMLLSSAGGIGFFLVLLRCGGSFAATSAAVMGLYMTTACMMNFSDSWAMRLIGAGARLHYGANRAGASFTYALAAAALGRVIARRGFWPNALVMAALFIPLAAVTLSLPDPPPAPRGPALTLGQGLRNLAGNRVYCLMLAAFFLSTLCTSAMNSFSSVLVLQLGGSEGDVGRMLFVQALCEIPTMVLYARWRRRIPLPASALLALSLFFYGCKSLAMGSAATCSGVIAASALQSCSFALFAPACVDFILETVSGEYLSTAHLLFLGLGQGAASMLGNLVNGALAQNLGVGAMLRAASAPAFAAAGLAAFAAYRQIRRKQP